MCQRDSRPGHPSERWRALYIHTQYWRGRQRILLTTRRSGPLRLSAGKSLPSRLLITLPTCVVDLPPLVDFIGGGSGGRQSGCLLRTGPEARLSGTTHRINGAVVVPCSSDPENQGMRRGGPVVHSKNTKKSHKHRGDSQTF